MLGLGCQSIADIPDNVTFQQDCRAYCDAMNTVCNGPAVQQYPNDEACMQACQLIHQRSNSSTDTASNTVACRSLEAEKINVLPDDRAEDCAAAGPGGAAVCTTETPSPYCEGYCTLYLGACGGRSSNPFKDTQIGRDGIIRDYDAVQNLSDCVKACKAVPALTSDVGEAFYSYANANGSDTIGCRLRAATIAARDPSAANCDLAGLRPQVTCRSEINCSDYCRVMSVACGDYYDNPAHCQSVCTHTDLGVKAERGVQSTLVGLDTISCRFTPAYVALLVASPHCGHAGVLGANTCGDNCATYCRLAKDACSDKYAEHPDWDDMVPVLDTNDDPVTDDSGNPAMQSKCVQACKQDLTGVTDAPLDAYKVKSAVASGASVQCRALFASRALNEAMSDDARATFCEAAFGGDPCN